MRRERGEVTYTADDHGYGKSTAVGKHEDEVDEGADSPEDEERPCCNGRGVVGVQRNVCFAVDDNHGGK